MSIYKDFQEIVGRLSASYSIPPISQVYFPPFFKGGQPKEYEFIGLQLESGVCGISFVLLPDDKMQNYQDMAVSDFQKKDPVFLARQFGAEDHVKNMVGLAALNAVCQHVIKTVQFELDVASDSIGLLDLKKGDRVGMIGLFRPLIKRVEDLGVHLTVFEQKEKLVHLYPQFNITTDLKTLRTCSKVLCTSTTVCNNTLDTILEHCAPEAFVSVIGPTAGYFPDPLFSRGVDVVGGTFIQDGDAFMQHLREQKLWWGTTTKFCFQKSNYPGIPL